MDVETRTRTQISALVGRADYVGAVEEASSFHLGDNPSDVYHSRRNMLHFALSAILNHAQQNRLVTEGAEA